MTTNYQYRKGLDASSVQGHLPVAALVAAGIEFVVLKAQQGNDQFDPYFVANATACAAAGIEVYAYCFAYPLPGKAGVFGRLPVEQARLFVERIRAAWPDALTRPLALDFEWPPYEQWIQWGVTGSSIADWMRACTTEVERLTGLAPVIYTYPFWWGQVALSGDVAWAANYALWIASYRAHPDWPGPTDRPQIPKPWTDWFWWQFDGNGGLKMPNGVDADFVVARRAAPVAAANDIGPGFDVVHPDPLSA